MGCRGLFLPLRGQAVQNLQSLSPLVSYLGHGPWRSAWKKTDEQKCALGVVSTNAHCKPNPTPPAPVPVRALRLLHRKP